jgi:hypothetical protein
MQSISVLEVMIEARKGMAEHTIYSGSVAMKAFEP